MRNWLTLLIFLGPALSWVIGLVIFPLILAFALSFTSTTLGYSLIGNFIGTYNYLEIFFKDPKFGASLWNSLIWTGGNLALTALISLGSALLLNEVFPGKSILRTLIILPWAIPSVATTISWRWMLIPEFGVIQHIMTILGLAPHPIAFFGPGNAMLSVILVNVWRFSPFATLVFLSALQSIPKELYEAAEIDGATSLKKFTNITLPNLKSVFIVMTVIGVLLTYGYFDVVWLTTRGGPGTETLIPPVYVWLSGFYEFNLGKAAAISTITAAIMLAFAIIYLKIATKK